MKCTGMYHRTVQHNLTDVSEELIASNFGFEKYAKQRETHKESVNCTASYTERVGVSVQLLARILGVTDSILGRDTGCSH